MMLLQRLREWENEGGTRADVIREAAARIDALEKALIPFAHAGEVARTRVVTGAYLDSLITTYDLDMARAALAKAGDE